MKSEIIADLESNGFEKVSEQAHYNYNTKYEVIIIEDEVSISNGVKKIYSGKLEKEEVLKNIK